jgi:RHS repeat-associated protein
MRRRNPLNDVPVATLRPNGSGGVNVFYVHTDHLNTPRRVSRPSDNVILWRWDSDPFGSTAASEDPDSDTNAFSYHLRFPGQYFDTETALNYNYFRDYDPSVGRYVESDPVGLEGGLNTYSYAVSNSIAIVDPTGLTPAEYLECLQDRKDFPQGPTRHCAQFIFASAWDQASETIQHQCDVIRNGIKCSVDCALRQIFGETFFESMLNIQKAAAMEALKKVARETASEAVKTGTAVIKIVDVGVDIYGTAKCSVNCVKQ